MPGPRPKPEGRRQRASAPKKPTVSAVAQSSIPQLPAPPSAPHWSAAQKKDWVELWAHPIVQAIDRTVHLAALRRLFDLRDEREKLAKIARSSPIVEGSTGQSRLHPAYARIGVCDTEIRNLEDRYGLNAKAGLDLGMQFNEAKKMSLDELASAADADTDEEDDPRLTQTGTKVIEVKATDA